VIGAVSTKNAGLETIPELRRKIDAASKYVPLENLSLSPQCGFASHQHGSGLTFEQQEAKLRLVVETAKEVWGTT
jgi:5-methyltetrahydropteroyltriglutamate--homocysteine methyltransferase